jgi:hypothetical protein
MATFYDEYRNKYSDNPSMLRKVDSAWRKTGGNNPIITRHKVNGIPIFKHQYLELLERERPNITDEEKEYNWEHYVDTKGITRNKTK